ncbi:YkgJ family cysteine cluster protein [Pseudodesulfovibrio thermohalotolerans]|uniref:YkgJ family cysteine cluster protein n=1 Tax=Pseudodesulfovibrio thermohalotolerans TaxID=2880651 RepID=UPI00244211D3|nr:YkgJ family cysteine cluster protein [Pseudodesulfovibrio thermohalotolerans]WFS61086.1 YkgJ family cysteine cluster protein [Pseudodesulfovibrio thermohalotolerans]
MTENAFECRMCGHCCQGEGGIVMTAKDRERLAAFLGIDVDELVSRYAHTRGGKIHLNVGENNYCVFFKEGCGVHPGRPDICRAWPYFRGNLIDKTSWEMIQDYCPGVNPDAGHEEFVRQGRAYLRKEDLLRYDPESSPNALISDE